MNTENPFSLKRIGRFLTINFVITVCLQIFFCPQCFSNADLFVANLDDVLYTFLLSCFLSGGIGVIIEKADQHFPWLDAPFSRLMFDIIVVSAYAFVVSFSLLTVFAVFVWDYFTFETISWDEIASNTVTPIVISLGLTLFFMSRSFLMEWRQAAIEAEQMKSERLAGQYQSLKDQLNPHFLFNSLNVLSNLVYEDADQANAFIEKLSKIYRYVLDVQYEELVSLEDEMAFAKNYLELQELRFGEKIRYEISVADTKGVGLPPLTLQLLLENAIKHNAATKQQPLSISLSREGDGLLINNSLNPRPAQPEKSGIGLNNIRERYRFMTEKEVKIDQSEGSFNVTVPLLKMLSTQ